MPTPPARGTRTFIKVYTDTARDADGLILRNTSVINFLDHCAITLPIHQPGTMPVGLMVIGEHGEDRRLLAAAAGIEAALTIAE